MENIDINTIPIGLVIESHSFSCIMNSCDDKLIERFLNVALNCKCVVACRMQPNQKAAIVRLIKDSQACPVLSIGDGANDEAMIKEANVGIGIRGVEATTAVQASDYAISQFQFLKRLMFIHGRNSLRRISTLICYIFYKTSLLCLTIFWFGIFSGFSGQNMFLEWCYQLYNVAFTALPILIFAVLDYDIDNNILQADPTIYANSLTGIYFNYKLFCSWFLNSFIHSIICFFFPLASYSISSTDSTGQSLGLWSFSILVYSCIVWITNLKIALLSRSWSFLHHISIW
jgi:magnesium-transporting ATPase (P-type)